jgi:hypothetical protein
MIMITYQEFSRGGNFSALKKISWNEIDIITSTSISLNVMTTSSTQEKQKTVVMLPAKPILHATLQAWF